ncbi:hypothetical protein DYB37_001154 [Aphanomyces astaci]|uniref:Uncharacterized protein n=1 Tax=Aphanomyces astaci TaxID=112090 RepID=A0A418FM24_APHAT|nr:hypothetical protein DYB37_001154 [Aphanomyces astaci]
MAQPYQAFHRLHELGASFEHTPKTVHLDVASAMTGVSRFGEQYPAWTYDYQYLYLKTEGLNDFATVDYVLTADPWHPSKQPCFGTVAFDWLEKDVQGAVMEPPSYKYMYVAGCQDSSVIRRFTTRHQHLNMPQPQKGAGSNKGVHAKGKGKDQDAGKGGNHRGAGAGKAGGAASGGR